MSWETAVAKATKQIDDCVKIVLTFLLPTYGRSFYLFYKPIHPAVALLYAAHESGRWNKTKKMWECLRFVKTYYPEIGLLQLTMRNGDNEVVRIGVNPLDPYSHIWAAQEAFAEGGDLIEPALKKYGYQPLGYLSAQHATALLLLIRSVGIGCTRGLLRMGKTAGFDPIRPMHGIGAWLRKPTADTTPFDGSQDTELVRLRVAWCWQCVTRCSELGIGAVGDTIDLMTIPRPDDAVPLPADFVANVDKYIREAKKEGYKPTGPWPKGEVV